MSLPLIILAAISCVAGFIPFGKFVTWNGEPYDFMAHFDWGVAGVSLVVAILGIGLAYAMYFKENTLPNKFRNAMPALWTWAYHRFYWDELYQFITHKIIFGSVCRPLAWFDRHIIDGTMDAFATITNKASDAIKPMQSGQIQMYVWYYLIGVLLLGGITAICLI